MEHSDSLPPPADWAVCARNLPEHARNAIHTDAGAQAAGFPRALVAGVTTYAYLTHPVVAAWGTAWLHGGAAEVRFRRPVFDGDEVRCVVESTGSEVEVRAITTEGDQPRATMRAWWSSGAVPDLRNGEPLRPVEIGLEGEWGTDYGWRAGDDLDIYRERGLVHPAVWPALANHVVHTQVARGSWIHLRSIVGHHGSALAGQVAVVESRVVGRRVVGSDERATLDVHVVVKGVVVAALEHEAIVSLG